MKREIVSHQSSRIGVMIAVGVFMALCLTFVAAQPVAAANVSYEDTTVAEGDVVKAEGEGSDIVSGSSYPVHEVVETFSGNDTVKDSTQVKSVTPQEDGRAYIHTSGVPAGSNYFLVGEYTDVSSGDVQVDDDTFEVVANSFDATLEDTTVKNAGDEAYTDLEFDSEQGSYDVIVTSDSLGDAELIGILSGQNDAGVSSDDLAAHVTSDSVSQHISFNTETQSYEVDSSFFSTETDELGDSASLADLGVSTIEDYRDVFEIPVVQTTSGDIVILQTDGGEISFNGVSPNTYSIDFQLADSGLTDSVSITVEELVASGGFLEPVYTQPAGGVAMAQVETDTSEEFVYVQIGGKEMQFVDVVKIRTNGDDAFTLKINTRLLGTGASSSEVYSVIDDDPVVADSGMHGSLGSDTSGSVFVDEDGDVIDTTAGSDFQAYLADLGLINSGTAPAKSQIIRPVQPGEYQLIAGVDRGNGVFKIDANDESAGVQELGQSQLELTEPEITGINTYAAPPGGVTEETELDDLRDQWTQTSEPAIGSRLIIEVEASGLGGYVSAQDDSVFDSTNREQYDLDQQYTELSYLNDVLNLQGDGISFSVEGESTGNQNPMSLDLSNSDTEEAALFIQDNSFYVVVDTRQKDAFNEMSELEDGDVFNIEMSYDVSSEEAYRFDTTSDDSVQGPFEGGAGGNPEEASFPYYPDGSGQSASTQVTFEEETVSYEPTVDGTIDLEAVDDARLTGNTNLPAGTNLEVVIVSKGNGSTFSFTQEHEINEDGFVSELDLSDVESGTEFEVRVSKDGEEISTAPGVVGGDLEEDQTQQESNVDPSEKASSTDEVSDDGENSSEEDGGVPAGSSGDSTPGFGVVAAITSLFSVAVVMFRREG